MVSGRAIRTRKKEPTALQTKRSEQVDAALVQWLSAGYSIGRACKAAGIGRRTFYDWKDAFPDFRQLVEDATETGTDVLEDTLYEHGKDGNVVACIFLLKARRPEIYRDRHEVTGANGAPLTIVIGERSDGPQ